MDLKFESLSVGIWSHLLRKGRINPRNLEQCAALAMRGSATHRTASHFRNEMVRVMSASAPELDSTFKAIHHTTPSLGNDTSQEQIGDLADMLIEDLQEGGDSAVVLQESFQKCNEWVTAISQAIWNLLSRTYDFEKNDCTEVSYRMFEIALASNALLSSRAQETTGHASGERMIGLNAGLINKLTSSIEAWIFRALSTSGELALRGAVSDVTGKTIRGNPQDQILTPGRRVSIFHAQNSMRKGYEDAESYSLLLHNPLPAVELDLPEIGAPEEVGSANLILPLGSRDFLYSFVRSTHQHSVVQERLHYAPVAQDDPSLFADRIHSFHIQANALSLSNECAYATLDSDPLLRDTLPAIRKILLATRHTIRSFLTSQPLIATSLPYIDTFVVHASEERKPITLTIPANSVPLFRQLLRDGSILNVSATPEAAILTLAPDDIERAEENVVPSGDSQKGAPRSAREFQKGNARKHMQFGELDNLLCRIGIEKVVGEGKGSHTKYSNPHSGKSCVLSRRYTSGHTITVPFGIIVDLLKGLALSATQLETYLREMSG
ncbi:hypothetical protein AUJ46_04985 [Candidatus Peregrinibacteria bacterium CG1_02_54_53]|nr:MAG: hypothetical protein AUJ46_04985 [Candidatus Peregrinibacteria bacterium CG1_02_54_53]